MAHHRLNAHSIARCRLMDTGLLQFNQTGGVSCCCCCYLVFRQKRHALTGVRNDSATNRARALSCKDMSVQTENRRGGACTYEELHLGNLLVNLLLELDDKVDELVLEHFLGVEVCYQEGDVVALFTLARLSPSSSSYLPAGKSIHHTYRNWFSSQDEKGLGSVLSSVSSRTRMACSTPQCTQAQANQKGHTSSRETA